MIPKNKSDTTRILRNCIHYMSHIDIYGGDAIEVAECLLFLKAWLKASGATRREMDKFKNEFERRKKK